LIAEQWNQCGGMAFLMFHHPTPTPSVNSAAADVGGGPNHTPVRA
jgi:hypothetical protein